MGFDYGYAWEKCYLARRAMMGWGTWEQRVADAFNHVEVLFSGVGNETTDAIDDQNIRELLDEILGLMDTSKLKDPPDEGLHTVRARAMNDIERSRFAEALDSVTTLLSRRPENDF